MPKLVKNIEEDEEYEDEEERRAMMGYEDEYQNDEEEIPLPNQNPKGAGRPKGTYKPGPPSSYQKKQEGQKVVKKNPNSRRFVPFANPPMIGIADAETNEIVAEGDLRIEQALANVLERLERIEDKIGTMQGE